MPLERNTTPASNSSGTLHAVRARELRPDESLSQTLVMLSRSGCGSSLPVLSSETHSAQRVMNVKIILSFPLGDSKDFGQKTGIITFLVESH